jgi:hypothetical protein
VPLDCKLAVDGVIKAAYDLNGKPIAIPNGIFQAKPQLVYLEGAAKVIITR